MYLGWSLSLITPNCRRRSWKKASSTRAACCGGHHYLQRHHRKFRHLRLHRCSEQNAIVAFACLMLRVFEEISFRCTDLKSARSRANASDLSRSSNSSSAGPTCPRVRTIPPGNPGAIRVCVRAHLMRPTLPSPTCRRRWAVCSLVRGARGGDEEVSSARACAEPIFSEFLLC
jgi:hypothetical protein